MAAAILTGATAQALEPVVLDRPDLNRGTNIMAALSARHSERAFADRMLSHRDLSDLLWAANGINRADGHRTAPSALNRQDVDIYVFTDRGAYLYDAVAGQLKPVADGDHRKLVVGGQPDFPLAPVFLVMVSDLSRFGDFAGDKAAFAGTLDAGIVSENISLFCSGTGLVTVPRMSMDVEGIKKLLGLGDHHLVVINNPVGYPVQ